jgi:asparagine synthetase B (glutamine-hydrolysing)
VAVNGEIYNHTALKAQIKAAHPAKKFRTESDCEVISHLYEDHGEKVASMLDGMFSFVLLDQNTNTFLVARCVFCSGCCCALYIQRDKHSHHRQHHLTKPNQTTPKNQPL